MQMNALQTQSACGHQCHTPVVRVHRRSSRMHTVSVSATATVEPSTSTSGTAQQPAMTSTQFLRPHLLKLAPYTPIEPFEILSARYGRKPEDIIKLDANENPYGPPPEVRKALGEMAFPHVYPDPETRRLRKALADMHGIPMEHLLVSQAARRAGQAITRRPFQPSQTQHTPPAQSCSRPGHRLRAEFVTLCLVLVRVCRLGVGQTS